MRTGQLNPILHAPIGRRTLVQMGGAIAIAALSPAHSADGPPHSKPSLKSWERADIIPLWPQKPPQAEQFEPRTVPADWSPMFVRNISNPALHVFRPRHSNHCGVLVIPGGAYQFVSVGNEGVDVARRLNALGFTVFVLTYRLPGEGWKSRADVPLQDAQRAMRLIRSRATALRIDGDRLSVLGFSAGGHLAATLSTGFGRSVYSPIDGADALSARPFAAALVYPVVTLQHPWTHPLSRDLLLGADASDELVRQYSAEFHIEASTPPMFLVHALDDTAVPVENTLRLMQALRDASRPFEAHLLQEGSHGFGVGLAGTPSAQWIDLFATWLTRRQRDG